MFMPKQFLSNQSVSPSVKFSTYSLPPDTQLDRGQDFTFPSNVEAQNKSQPSNPQCSWRCRGSLSTSREHLSGLPKQKNGGWLERHPFVAPFGVRGYAQYILQASSHWLRRNLGKVTKHLQLDTSLPRSTRQLHSASN